jgi:lipooligosaccharide transport system ATP-binding protein
VAIIHQGKIIDIDTPDRLVSRYIGSQVWEIDLTLVEQDEIIGELKRRQLDYEEFAGMVHVFQTDSRSTEGLPGSARAASLEDVFFKLTGRSLRE